MKNNKLTLLSTAALAAGAFLLAPNAIAADPGTERIPSDPKEQLDPAAPRIDLDSANTKVQPDPARTTTELDSADSKFIQEEAAAGGAMLKLAELGVKKAERADVKAFAEMMVTDHTKANDELAALAASKGVELTTEVDRKHEETYEKLDGKNDADFDGEFISVMVKGHKRCVEKFEDASEDAKDNEVKMWAAKMLPALQAHLKGAEELNPATEQKDGRDSTENHPTQPDNTARNERDRDSRTLTPLDQGNSKTDTDTTAEIRREIMALDVSSNAKNVKIITREGHVTLRGPVASEEEKTLIGEIANRIATEELTDNQIEVKVDTDN